MSKWKQIVLTRAVITRVHGPEIEAIECYGTDCHKLLEPGDKAISHYRGTKTSKTRHYCPDCYLSLWR